MIKILDSKKNNFNSSLDNLLLKRKNKIKFNSSIVTNIIKDIKKNEEDILYQDDYENLKNLKFKDFLNLNENIKYVEPEEAIKFIASS